MGKGQRAREARIQDKLNNPQKYTVKKKSKFSFLAPIATILVIILIVAFFAMNYLQSSGVLLRSKTAMETENFKITGTMMQFAVMSSYQNFASQNADYLSYFGLDTSKRLDSQPYGDGTWLDYFKEGARSSVEEILIYAEGAKAAGVELSKEDLDLIESNSEMYNIYAAAYGYTLDSYLALMYGKGVKIKDIKAFQEISTLAQNYMEQLSDEVEDGIAENEVEEYYLTTQAQKAKADVLLYEQKIEFPEDMSLADREAKKAELTQVFSVLASAKTDDEFKASLRSYLETVEYDKETKDENGNKTTEKATYTKEEIDKMIEDAAATIVASDVSLKNASDWIYEESDDHIFLRADGDIKMFENIETKKDAQDKKDEDTSSDTEADTGADTSVDTDAETGADTETAEPEEEEVLTEGKAQTYTICVYRIVKAPYRDTTITKNVGHILVTTNTYGSDAKAKEKAQEILDKFKSGEQTKDEFEKIANEYTEDSSVFYENVAKGGTVEEFDAWIYDSVRKEGDTDIVKTDYGYHVMYFVGDGLEAWYSESFFDIVNKTITEKYEEALEKYPISTNEKTIDAISG